MPTFIALIHKDAKSDFGVSFPDLPGCISAGATLDEARAMAAEALAMHLQGMVEDGDAIPRPSTLDAVMADPHNRSAVVMVVDAADVADPTVRINVTMPQSLLAQVDAQAEANGQSRSGFLGEAAKAKIAAPNSLGKRGPSRSTGAPTRKRARP